MLLLKKSFLIFIGLLFCFSLTAQVEDTIVARQYLDSLSFYSKAKKYDIALPFGEQALDLYKKVLKEPDTLLANAYYELGIVYYRSKKYKRALEYLHSAIDNRLAVLKEADAQVADAYNVIGVIHHISRDYEKALEYYERSISSFSKIFGEEHVDLARPYFNVGLIYKTLSQFDTAIEFYEKSEAICLKAGEKKLKVYANVENNLGTVYYLKGDYQTSVKYYTVSADLKVKVYGENHPETLKTFSNIGAIYFAIDKFEKAIDYYTQIVEVQIEELGKDDYILAASYNNLGGAYQRLGDYEKALVYYQEALKIKLNTLEKDDPEFSGAYNNIALTYSALGDYEQALKYQEKSMEIGKKSYEKNHAQLSEYYANFGTLYLRTEKFDKALESYHKALEINQINHGEQHKKVASNYTSIGLVYKKQGDYKTALEFYRKGKAIKEEILDPFDLEMTVSYMNIASVLTIQENFTEAKSNYKKSLEIFTKIFGLKNDRVARVNNLLGEIAVKENEFERAGVYFEKALNSMESYRSNLGSKASDIFYQSSQHDIIENSIHASLNLFSDTPSASDFEKVFQTVENGKSSLLLKAINTSKATSFSDLPDSLLQLEYDFRTDITYFEKRVQKLIASGKSSSDSLVLLEQGKLFEVNNQYDLFIQRLEKDFPNYHNAKYAKSTIDLSEIQNELLKENQCLIEYFVGQKNVYIFLIKKNTFLVKEVLLDFPLDTWVNTMTKEGLYAYYTLPRSKRNKRLAGKSFLNYSNAAQDLYQKLIAPIADHLEDEIIIIPDGILGYLPFESFLTSAPKKIGAFKSYPYLINQHQISYCYSAALLKEMKEKKHLQKTDNELLAFAPFFYDNGEFQVKGVGARDSLGVLLSSGKEVAGIGEFFQTTTFFGKEASISHLQENVANSRLLHFSTHGKADDRVGDFAYLAFGALNHENSFEKLYARDLYNYNFNADMVVLSACETGIGKLQKGEGIISLARAFAYAGAKSIFTTLWQVDDEKTKDLMLGFYKNLKVDKLEKDEALRNAKLDYLKQNNDTFAHPFFWAALIGIGDMSKLEP